MVSGGALAWKQQPPAGDGALGAGREGQGRTSALRILDAMAAQCLAWKAAAHGGAGRATLANNQISHTESRFQVLLASFAALLFASKDSKS